MADMYIRCSDVYMCMCVVAAHMTNQLAQLRLAPQIMYISLVVLAPIPGVAEPICEWSGLFLAKACGAGQ